MCELDFALERERVRGKNLRARDRVLEAYYSPRRETNYFVPVRASASRIRRCARWDR